VYFTQGYDDLLENCVGASLAACKAKCALNAQCGGFNYPHGIMKKKDCLAKKAASVRCAPQSACRCLRFEEDL